MCYCRLEIEVRSKGLQRPSLKLVKHKTDASSNIGTPNLCLLHVDVQGSIISPRVEVVAQLEHIRGLARLPLLVQHKIFAISNKLFDPLSLENMITQEARDGVVHRLIHRAGNRKGAV